MSWVQSSPQVSWTRSPSSTPFCSLGLWSRSACFRVRTDGLRAAYFILGRNTPYRKLGAAFFDRLATTKATANIIRSLRALG